MKTLSFAFLAVMLSVPGRAASFTVTHGEDSGDGSLRQAILSANAAAGADVINFSLGVFSVQLNTVLPVITGELTIDAVRPGSTDTNPPVEVVLTAASAGPADALMDFSGSGALTVRGLALDHGANLAATLRVTSPGGTVLVELCRIGQNLTAQDSTGSGDRLLFSGTAAQPLARFDIKQTTIRGSMLNAGVRVKVLGHGAEPRGRCQLLTPVGPARSPGSNALAAAPSRKNGPAENVVLGNRPLCSAHGRTNDRHCGARHWRPWRPCRLVPRGFAPAIPPLSGVIGRSGSGPARPGFRAAPGDGAASGRGLPPVLSRAEPDLLRAASARALGAQV